MIIYKITNLINNKIYIGQTTKTAEQRFNKHWSEANCENRPNNYFHNALLAYGKENFKIEVIDTASSLDELNKKEEYWIDKLNSTDKSIGYNLQSGGKSGIKNQTTKDLIRQKKLKNWEDPIFAQNCREGLKKATLVWKNICEENKKEIICKCCGKVFKVSPYEAETRKYCSQSCANSINIKKATEVAAKKKTEVTKLKHKKFKEEAENWCLNNVELILNCPFNKISTVLKPIQDLAFEKYDIIDWRTIAKAICNSNSKKDLLLYLKEKVENVR